MSKIACITGAAGGVGFTMVKFLLERGWNVVSIDNNFRGMFFGDDGDVSSKFDFLKEFTLFYEVDIRNEDKIYEIFETHDFNAIFHFAAQPSHDWAAKNPILDFDIHARATLILLESVLKCCPEVPFIYTSTNKVYGDTPNKLPLKEFSMRYEFDDEHFINGITESMSIDKSLHSIFGASKVAGDMLVQEYGKYFGMNTVCFRGGCLTGVAHAGAELHGALNYLVKCATTNKPYTIFGYRGKQVRDQLDFSDLCSAFYEFYLNPRKGEVYNIGGGHENSISILETIEYLDKKHNIKLNYSYDERPRKGDHICYYSCLNKFKMHYPNWVIKKSTHQIIDETVASILEKNEQNT